MAKENFHREMLSIIEEIKNSNIEHKPKLLLHACCAPCSSHCLELLAQTFDITIYYYNPNIHPQEEYFRRLEELENFLTIFPVAVNNQIKLVKNDYHVEDFFTATNVQEEVELQVEPEKGERCRRCYQFRMTRAWEFAEENQFDYFTTTLSISPHKDSKKIDSIGRQLEKLSRGKKLKFLPSDFKKENGFLRSLQLSDEFNLYRQDYCGCIYSKLNQKK